MATVFVAIAAVLSVYVLNPLRTPDTAPFGRVLGLRLMRLPSASMEPTIPSGAFFIVSEWAYLRAPPKVGDIVVFQSPLDRPAMYSKRIIAAGKSTIAIADGVTIIDGRVLSEPYLQKVQSRVKYMKASLVAPNSYFVMGDNRNNSEDSRYFGPVPSSHIVGKVIWQYKFDSLQGT